jgi:D-alanyl-D-alanine carboxypeptidase
MSRAAVAAVAKRAAVAVAVAAVVIAVAVGVVHAAAPPSPAVRDVGAALEAIRAPANIPALTGATWRNGEVIARGVSGVRKLGDATRAGVDDEWHLGSDTKAMTATLIGIYVDRRRLRFEDTLDKLFAGEKLDPGYAKVTLLQLLQHRGGAPGDMPPDIWQRMWQDGNSPTARLTAVRALLSRPPAQAPGTFVYANAGYMIAGAALERLTGKTWEALMREELFRPLGMSSCGFGAPGHARPNKIDQPWGHSASPAGALVPVSPADPASDNPPSLGPAGTVHCSLADWGKFFAVHLAGARGEKTPLVTTATIKLLQTPPAGGDYACGWLVTSRPWAGGTTLTHSGSNTMWFATVWLAPAKNFAVAAASNSANPAAMQAVDAAFAPLIDAALH